MGAETLCHYLFAVWLICSLCHVWAAINKKSRWKEDLNSLIQLWNDLKFIHKSHTNTQKPFSRGGPRDTDLELKMKNEKVKAYFCKGVTQGQVQVHCSLPCRSFAFFCLLPTLTGSLPFPLRPWKGNPLWMTHWQHFLLSTANRPSALRQWHIHLCTYSNKTHNPWICMQFASVVL